MTVIATACHECPAVTVVVHVDNSDLSWLQTVARILLLVAVTLPPHRYYLLYVCVVFLIRLIHLLTAEGSMGIKGTHICTVTPHRPSH